MKEIKNKQHQGDENTRSPLMGVFPNSDLESMQEINNDLGLPKTFESGTVPPLGLGGKINFQRST